MHELAGRAAQLNSDGKVDRVADTLLTEAEEREWIELYRQSPNKEELLQYALSLLMKGGHIV